MAMVIRIESVMTGGLIGFYTGITVDGKGKTIGLSTLTRMGEFAYTFPSRPAAVGRAISISDLVRDKFIGLARIKVIPRSKAAKRDRIVSDELPTALKSAF